MNKSLTVLLIEDNPDYAALVQQWLSMRTDLGYVVHWAESLRAGLNLLRQGGFDVILVDLGLPDSDGLETFTRIQLQASAVPVIILSGDDSEKLALQTVLDGAQDFIVKGTCNSDSLAKAIQYAVVRATKRATMVSTDLLPGPATVIGVLGVKGGVGSTTIACNLAAELRLQTGKKTLLADLDLESGLVGFLMNAPSEYSVMDAVRNVDRLDVSFWEGLVFQGAGGLDILRSPSLPGVATPDRMSLVHVLAMIRQLYAWMVVDLGRLDGFSMGLLDNITELALVTTTSIPALYEAKRAIAALRKAGFEGERLKVIVNQLSKAQEYSESELSDLFGVPVFAKFAAAGQELHSACVKKTLPAQTGEFRVRMASMVQKLAGLPTPKPKSKVSQLFSFTEKAPAASAR